MSEKSYGEGAVGAVDGDAKARGLSKVTGRVVAGRSPEPNSSLPLTYGLIDKSERAKLIARHLRLLVDREGVSLTA